MKILAFDTSTSSAALALWQDHRYLVDCRYQFGNQHSQFLLTEIEHLLRRVSWERQDLNALVVGLGPGSFTGLRVGVATAQGLSFALSRPLYGASSLDALAQSAPSGPPLVVACVDARKQELYVRIYRRPTLSSPANPPVTADIPSHSPYLISSQLSSDASEHPAYVSSGLPTLIPVTPHLLLTPDALARRLQDYGEDALLVGSGASLYHAAIQRQISSQLWRPTTSLFDELWASQLIPLAWPDILAGGTRHAHQIQPIYIRPSEAEMNIGPPGGGTPLKHRLQEDGTILPDSKNGTSRMV